jgi:cytochrome c-type biogenesis protein CcsB
MKCEDFIIERYPGSEVASSYASDLQILDSAGGNFSKRRVFMNHVLDHGGYRFFQSGYDPDEQGTRLSVNYDYWGTNITYVGYLLMGIGMVLSLFARSGRFRYLLKRMVQPDGNSKTLSMLLVLFSLSFTMASAQVDSTEVHDHSHEQHDHDHNHEHAAAPAPEKSNPTHRIMSKEHSDELARLLVEDFDGRIVPMHTMCDEILRKLYRSSKYEGKNAVQIVTSMHMYPEYWADQKIIQVPSAVRAAYGLGSYASFNELSDRNFDFKWMDDYNRTMQKRESERSETEKKLIKLVEKHQVFVGVSQWAYMKVLPVKNDPGNNWYVPLTQEIMKRDTVSSKLLLDYLTAVHEASETGNYRNAVKLLGDLMAFQRSTAPAHILPSETSVSMEISYNKMGIFKNSMYMYMLLGFFGLIFFIIDILTPARSVKAQKRKTVIYRVLLTLITVIFLYHGAGLYMRSYISGHAPWSNGYEAMVYIGWVAVLAGFIFARYSRIILPAATLLAFFLVFVTEMNLLDPEITPLQPVLKSYWLMIHVAIITGSYAFLGLSFIIGFVNMILYMARGKGRESVTQSIHQLTRVSELTMTIGLFMLTIGTFLGGVWANESWGRYWGWDPKETWALVSVLVYAIILHLRFIPALKGKFVFNVLSFWGYSAILFTFFGVNFILVGLHSYAQGEGSVGLPWWLVLIIVFFAVFTGFAIFRNNKYNREQRLEL